MCAILSCTKTSRQSWASPKIGNTVKDKVEDKVKDKVQDNVGKTVGCKVEDEIEDQVEDEIEEKSYSEWHEAIVRRDVIPQLQQLRGKMVE